MKSKGYSLWIASLQSIGVIASEPMRQRCVVAACSCWNFLIPVVREQRDRRGQDSTFIPSEARDNDLQTSEGSHPPSPPLPPFNSAKLGISTPVFGEHL